MNRRPQMPKATRAARNGEPQPPPPNIHTLPRIRISPEMATALYYSRYPHAIPPNSTVTSGEMEAARMVAAAAHHTLTRNPERYVHEQSPWGDRPPRAGPEVAKMMRMQLQAEAAAGRAPGGVGAAAAANNNNNNNNNNTNTNGSTNTSATVTPTPVVRQYGPGFVAVEDYEDIYNDVDDDENQPAGGDDGDVSPSPIELNINTGVTVSQSDNMVVLSASPADMAAGVAAAVLAAIEQASSARVGIPMIDESGAPRPLRVRVDASIRIGGSGNVLGPEALVRECLLTRAAAAAAAAAAAGLPREAGAAADKGKRARDEAEEWDEEDNDAESVGSKKSRSA
ncbi:hypothetical protein RB594_003141 [Gaeumannomyces avenae]